MLPHNYAAKNFYIDRRFIIARIMTNVHYDNENNLKDEEELCNKKAMKSSNEFGRSKTNNDNRSFFQKGPSRITLFLVSMHAPRPSYDQQVKK